MHGEMSIEEYWHTDLYGIDYVYLYENYWGWSVRPCFGYCLKEIAENNEWEKY